MSWAQVWADFATLSQRFRVFNVLSVVIDDPFEISVQEIVRRASQTVVKPYFFFKEIQLTWEALQIMVEHSITSNVFCLHVQMGSI